MNNRVMLSTLVVAAVMSSDLAACGDKFLVPGRGPRFQAQAIDRAVAAVLVYGSPGSVLNTAASSLSVEAALQKAGYRPTVVTTAAAFDEALRRGGWDVVVLDLADGALVSGRPPAGDAPVVLPVAHEAPRATLEAAKRQYRHVLTSSSKPAAFVTAVDKLIAARMKARKAAARIGA